MTARLVYRPPASQVIQCRQPGCDRPTKWKLDVHPFNCCDQTHEYYTCSACYYAWRSELNDLFIHYRRFLPIFCACGWPIADVDDIIVRAEPYLLVV